MKTAPKTAPKTANPSLSTETKQPKTSPPRKRVEVETPAGVLAGLPDRVRDEVSQKYRENGGVWSGRWDKAAKLAMAQAIFDVESPLENAAAAKGAGRGDKRQAVVRDLNRRRNLLLDATGENEPHQRDWWPRKNDQNPQNK